ncbi:hypothetical protein [Burkholderia pseudomallei]|uniref:hypothetical protein n=1 Tax=Burkholderia pseudomallei TaxID=28450 RepID=UPI000A662991|nr:hypothetical protein [Burkholderia pseudomallei]
MSNPLTEMFRRNREARQLEAAPRTVAALAAANAQDAYLHAQLQNDAASPVNSDVPEILEGARPLYFEITPYSPGVVTVNYSRRESFQPKRTMGAVRHENLEHALLRLLADVQPDDIDICRGSAEGDDDE